MSEIARRELVQITTATLALAASTTAIRAASVPQRPNAEGPFDLVIKGGRVIARLMA